MRKMKIGRSRAQKKKKKNKKTVKSHQTASNSFILPQATQPTLLFSLLSTRN